MLRKHFSLKNEEWRYNTSRSSNTLNCGYPLTISSLQKSSFSVVFYRSDKLLRCANTHSKTTLIKVEDIVWNNTPLLNCLLNQIKPWFNDSRVFWKSSLIVYLCESRVERFGRRLINWVGQLTPIIERVFFWALRRRLAISRNIGIVRAAPLAFISSSQSSIDCSSIPVKNGQWSLLSQRFAPIKPIL